MKVRANNLQELVYKNGQAGIKKATVSIVFDNSKVEDSPCGYESFPQLTITRQIVGGKNKCLINGVTATSRRIQDLFHSVKLNVNNPHFLIMQGRITKVLNMKPPEILSLLEEAAGTKLYEQKKEQSLKVMEKKDLKLREINDLLQEEIGPTLSGLREERSNFIKYEKVSRELEHLKKFIVAFDYVAYLNIINKNDDVAKHMSQEVDAHNKCIQEFEEKKESAAKDIESYNEEKQKYEGDAIKVLEEELDNCYKEEAVTINKVKRVKEDLKTGEKNVIKFQHQIAELNKLYDSKNKEAELAAGKEYQKLVDDSTEAQNELDEAENNLQCVNAGLVKAEDGSTTTLTEQVRVFESEKVSLETSQTQTKMRLDHLKKEIATKKVECQKAGAFSEGKSADEKISEDLGQKLNKFEAEVKEIVSQEEDIGGSENILMSKHNELSKKCREITYAVESSTNELPHLKFRYSDPERNFDHSRVHGIVANLIHLKDTKFAQALQVAAGGKLFNVVVDNEQTSNLLLKHGQLRNRVTMLPLNRMKGHVIPNEVLRRAESVVGRGNVFTAISLIDFDPILRPAMEYCFGNVLICPDLDTANKVAFAKGVERRTVTLEGDVFDPQGTLSGGSAAHRGAPLLLKVRKLQEQKQELESLNGLIQKSNEQLKIAARLSKRKQDLEMQISRIKHDLEEVEFRLRQTDKHRIRTEYENMTNEYQQAESEYKDIMERLSEARKKLAEVQKRIANAKQEQAQAKKRAEARLTAAKKRVDILAAKMEEKENVKERLRLEAEAALKDREASEQSLENMEKVVSECKLQVTEITASAEQAKENLAIAKEKLRQHNAELQSLNKRIIDSQKECEKISRSIAAAKLEIQRIEAEMSGLSKSNKDAETQLAHMRKNNPWIAEEEQHFGKENGAFCFTGRDINEAKKDMKSLQQTKDELGRTVNVRVMHLLSKAEQEYSDLLKRQEIVLKDKKKIQDVIDGLDEKRTSLLNHAYIKVNDEFDKIFGTLLPNSKAHLKAPDGKTIFDGLEFRIGFGNVWKDSLSELSGGQRSLVALSLILALLTFQPAPLYILDEVDAALDLSHTQNIGRLIKNHFKNSQFIIVSLKDGMFNNANVLFKTKFDQGVSTVSRHVSSSVNPLGTNNAKNRGKR